MMSTKKNDQQSSESDRRELITSNTDSKDLYAFKGAVLANSSSPIKEDLLNGLVDEHQLFHFQKRILTGKPSKTEAFKDYIATEFCVAPSVVEPFSEHLTAFVVQYHLNFKKQKEPRKRLTFTPSVADKNNLEDHRKGEELIENVFPEIGESVIDRSICAKRGGKYVPLTTNELNNPDLVIQDATTMSVPKDRISRQMAHLAAKNQFHPCKDQIDACGEEFPEMTEDEAKNIIFNIPRNYFHNDEEVANLMMGQLILNIVGLASLDTQVQSPNYCLILCGEQGTFKSTCWEIIGTLGDDRNLSNYSVVSASPDRFFSDYTLQSTAAVMEFAEIERFTTTKHLDALKSVITDKNPIGRMPYDRMPTRRKRFAVYVGSTNHPTAVLQDRSSAYDRRMIPIQIPTGQFIKINEFKADIRKIYAAALLLYRLGHGKTAHIVPASLYEELGNYQADFKEVTPFEEALLGYAGGMNTVDPAQALIDCFGKTLSEVLDSEIRDARNLFKAELPNKEWEFKRKYTAGRGRPWVFVRKPSLTDGELQEARNQINSKRQQPILFPPINPSDDPEHDF